MQFLGVRPAIPCDRPIERFDAENLAGSSPFAVDLGCPEGRDTVELQQRGWRVLAVDGETEAIARLQNRPDIAIDRLQTLVSRFENAILLENVDLVNASFSLAFCQPEDFPQVWENIVKCLRSGGRFSGQLFGDRDSWAIYTSINHRTHPQV